MAAASRCQRGHRQGRRWRRRACHASFRGGGHPLLVTGSYGKGRTVAWTSDIGPHWVPNEFVAWAGYATIWKNILRWASQTN
jgi:uncharacterized membrane protein